VDVVGVDGWVGVVWEIVEYDYCFIGVGEIDCVLLGCLCVCCFEYDVCVVFVFWFGVEGWN